MQDIQSFIQSVIHIFENINLYCGILFNDSNKFDTTSHLPRGTAAYRSVGVVKYQTILGQSVEVGSLTDLVSVASHFKTSVVSCVQDRMFG